MGKELGLCVSHVNSDPFHTNPDIIFETKYFFNPLSPSIHIQILQTDPYTFP